MRFLTYIMPIFVLIQPLFAAEGDTCASRLATPVQAIVKIIEIAIEQNVIRAEDAEENLSADRWRNPFEISSHLKAPQFRKAFAEWDARLAADRRPEFLKELNKSLRRHAAAVEVSREAGAATADLLSVHGGITKFEDPDLAPGREVSFTRGTWQGRPVFTSAIVKGEDLYYELLWDPFNKYASKRIRYFPSKSGEGISRVHFFKWKDKLYLIRPQEKVVFDVETGEEVSRRFSPQKKLKIEGLVHFDSVVVDSKSGPQLIAIYTKETGARNGRIFQIPLTGQRGEATELFSGETLKLPTIATQQFAGRTILQAGSRKAVWMWDVDQPGDRFVVKPKPYLAFTGERFPLFKYQGKTVAAMPQTVAVGGSRDFTLSLVNVETGKHIRTLDDQPSLSNVMAVPVGSKMLLVTRSGVGRIDAFDLETGEMPDFHIRDAYSNLSPFNFRGQNLVFYSTQNGRFGIQNLDAPAAPLRGEIEGLTITNIIDTFEHNGAPYALLSFMRGYPVILKLTSKTGT